MYVLLRIYVNGRGRIGKEKNSSKTRSAEREKHVGFETRNFRKATTNFGPQGIFPRDTLTPVPLVSTSKRAGYRL